MSITEELVFMVTPLWSRCPRVFVHWVVFRGLSQGLALICGPDCDSFVGAIWCWNSRGLFLPYWSSPVGSVLHPGNLCSSCQGVRSGKVYIRV